MNLHLHEVKSKIDETPECEGDCTAIYRNIQSIVLRWQTLGEGGYRTIHESCFKGLSKVKREWKYGI